MNTPSDIKINNTVILATISEVTKAVLSKLDGEGLDIQRSENNIDDQILSKLIASRICSRLSARKI